MKFCVVFGRKTRLTLRTYSQTIFYGSAAQKDEFLVGIEAVKADLDAALIEIPPCILLHAEFHAVSNGSKYCTVMGKYLTTTDKTANFFLQNIQRCTFVWENTRDGMKVHHIHVSNPLGELQLTDDERFPTTMGKMAQVYMNRQIKQLAESRRISLAGENGTVYSLMQSEIMYITAFSKDSIITSVNGEILIKKGISKLSKMLDGQFIPIHRGYIVNPDYGRHPWSTIQLPCSMVKNCRFLKRNTIKSGMRSESFTICQTTNDML